MTFVFTVVLYYKDRDETVRLLPIFSSFDKAKEFAKTQEFQGVEVQVHSVELDKLYGY